MQSGRSEVRVPHRPPLQLTASREEQNRQKAKTGKSSGGNLPAGRQGRQRSGAQAESALAPYRGENPPRAGRRTPLTPGPSPASRARGDEGGRVGEPGGT